jgi:hypothetical protein
MQLLEYITKLETQEKASPIYQQYVEEQQYHEEEPASIYWPQQYHEETPPWYADLIALAIARVVDRVALRNTGLNHRERRFVLKLILKLD